MGNRISANRDKALAYLVTGNAFSAGQGYDGQVRTGLRKDGWLHDFLTNAIRDIRDMDGVWVEISPMEEIAGVYDSQWPHKTTLVPLAVRPIDPKDCNNQLPVNVIFVQKYVYEIMIPFYRFVQDTAKINAPVMKVNPIWLTCGDRDKQPLNPFFMSMDAKGEQGEREIPLLLGMPYNVSESLQEAFCEYARMRAAKGQIHWRLLDSSKLEASHG